MQKSSIFGSSNNEDNKPKESVVVFGENKMDFVDDYKIIRNIYKTEEIIILDSASTEEVIKKLNQINEETRAKLTLIHTGTSDGRYIPIIEHLINNPLTSVEKLDVVDLVEMVYKGSSMVTTNRTIDGVPNKTKVNYKDLDSKSIGYTVLHVPRSEGILCCTDRRLEYVLGLLVNAREVSKLNLAYYPVLTLQYAMAFGQFYLNEVHGDGMLVHIEIPEER